MISIIAPTFGESVTDATVGQWSKNIGDRMIKDELLVELETEKVALEIVAPADGVLSEILATTAQTINAGALLGRMTPSEPRAVQPAAHPPPAVAHPASAIAPLLSRAAQPLPGVAQPIAKHPNKRRRASTLNRLRLPYYANNASP
jgi:2-oxoglutarate dehydrogenase E2 component (dihydrolipoamide succinyltransferase)